MSIARLRHEEISAPLNSLNDPFRTAMRHLAGAVSVISVGRGNDISGLTATSVSSLSLEPPTILVSINRAASSWPLLNRHGCFGVNVLSDSQADIAERFAGRDGLKHAERFQGADWEVLETGAPMLIDALAAFDCKVERIIGHHSHSIVIGEVKSVRIQSHRRPLLYLRGAFGRFEELGPIDD